MARAACTLKKSFLRKELVVSWCYFCGRKEQKAPRALDKEYPCLRRQDAWENEKTGRKERKKGRKDKNPRGQKTLCA
jgi:hypothetical protein